MPELNRERLTHLITVLETVREKRKPFNLSTWMGEVGPDHHGNVGRVNECGTACCALGYAALDPEFNSQGLKMELVVDHREIMLDGTSQWREETMLVSSLEEFNKVVKRSNEDDDFGILEVFPIFEKGGVRLDEDGFLTGAHFFGLTEREARHLFDPCSYDDEKITPKMVINRIQKLLEA